MPAAERSLAILAFHKIGEPPAGTWTTWNYISEAIFVAQLETLSQAGYAVIGLPEFLAGLEHPDALPERAALLTFDDGYASMLTVTQPILTRFEFPAVLFVPTDHVGGSNRFDHDNEPDEPICDWEQLRELTARGTQVQSHGVTHRTFAELTTAELVRELADSKACLEDALQQPVEVLAFPYGDGGTDPETTDRELERAGYKAACLYKGGVVKLPAGARYRLGRVPMGPDTNLDKWLGGAA